MSDVIQLPLFTIRSVLYPGSLLQLKVFEPRYLRMVSDCMRRGSDFGVCLIKSGKEVGVAAQPYEVGTLACIIDWTLCEDGLLGITVRGRQRFRVHSTHVQMDNLLVGEVSYFDEEVRVELPRQYQDMAYRLREIMEKAGSALIQEAENFGDASWVSFRLAELLPVGFSQRQYLLQIEDPLQRLERVCSILESIEQEE